MVPPSVSAASKIKRETMASDQSIDIATRLVHSLEHFVTQAAVANGIVLGEDMKRSSTIAPSVSQETRLASVPNCRSIYYQVWREPSELAVEALHCSGSTSRWSSATVP